MKKCIRNILILIMTTLLLMPVWACQTDLSVIDGQLPPYELEYNTAIGDHPDVDGFKVDGKTDDQLWESVEKQQYTVEGKDITITAMGYLTQKGLCFAITFTDSNIFWERKIHARNTVATIEYNSVATSGKNIKSTVEALGVYPSYEIINSKTSYEGELVNGKISGSFSVEAFVSWEDLWIDCKPDDITVTVTYKHKTNKVAEFTSSSTKFTFNA